MSDYDNLMRLARAQLKEKKCHPDYVNPKNLGNNYVKFPNETCQFCGIGTGIEKIDVHHSPHFSFIDTDCISIMEGAPNHEPDYYYLSCNSEECIAKCNFSIDAFLNVLYPTLVPFLGTNLKIQNKTNGLIEDGWFLGRSSILFNAKDCEYEIFLTKPNEKQTKVNFAEIHLFNHNPLNIEDCLKQFLDKPVSVLRSSGVMDDDWALFKGPYPKQIDEKEIMFVECQKLSEGIKKEFPLEFFFTWNP